MSDNLFTALYKYIPSENQDPLENYITEAFAWILNTEQELARTLLKEVLEVTINIGNKDSLQFTTQVNFDGKRPDMVCTVGDNASKIIFEHKVWSPPYPEQIENYRNYAEENFTNYALYLITAPGNMLDNSDVQQCTWTDIYKAIAQWVENNSETGNSVVINSFLTFLKEQGLSPSEPISYSMVRYFNHSKRLTEAIEGFLKHLSNDNSKRLKEILGKYYPEYSKKWGSYGFEFFRTDEDWHNPSFFIGFVLDELSYKLKPVNASIPDFSIIFDIDEPFHSQYPSNRNYLQLKADLQKLVQNSEKGWDFYDIADHGEGVNKWHPIHIRVPMDRIFKGTATYKEQANRFLEYAGDLVPKILELTSLQRLKKDFG